MWAARYVSIVLGGEKYQFEKVCLYLSSKLASGRVVHSVAGSPGKKSVGASLTRPLQKMLA